MKSVVRVGSIAWFAALVLAVGCSVGKVPAGGEDAGGSLADGSGANANAGEGGGSSGPDAGGEDRWVDTDDDGHIDRFDNCPETPNRDQEDADGDGVGDACDNRPECANASQETDLCGERGYDPSRDTDGDGVPDVDDNCPEVENDGQNDTDGDEVGDGCDNCPDVSNRYQEDADGDGTGDACAAEPAGEICRTKETEFVGVEPNIYFVFDTSSSMSGLPMTQAKKGLDEVAKALAPAARLGLSNYPEGDLCGSKERLAIGSHTVSEVQNSYSNLTADGGTPTGSALFHVRDQNRLEVPSDPKDDDRPKIVVLITDGSPNACEGVHRSRDEAAALKNEGVKTYVVSFKKGASPYELNAIAKAGGTDAPGSFKRYYEADDASQLVKALSRISSKIVPCTFELESPPPDPSRIWVEFDGDYLKRGSSADYTYDSSTNTIELSDSACKRLRSAVSSGPRPMKISFGCPGECESSEEVCDGRDNDCDGEVDEDCEGCDPEVCDGDDNDCDGDIDEGCCAEKADGESCSSDGACCSGYCTNDGVCGEPCRPVGVSCLSDSDCCSGKCGGNSGDSTGSCVAG